MSATKKTDRIYLRDDETKVLQSLLEEWSDKSDKKSRDAFVSGTAVPKIQGLNLKDYGPDIISTSKVAKVQWEKRVNAVYTWFKNHKPFKDRQVFKLERKIPLRRVVGKAKATEINDIIITQHPDLHRGDKTYPGIYQKAVTEFMRNMSDEEIQEMQELLEEWQAEGPPLDVRLKAAKKYGRKAVVNAHQLLDKEMYISCITLSMVPDPDTGSMGVTCHDYIAELHAVNHGRKFKSFRDWSGPKYSAFMEHIINYANYVKDQRNEEEEKEEVSPAPVLFTAGPGGLPLLPAPMHGVRSTETARHAKDIIRSYFLKHYQLATGCEAARTPWANIGAAPDDFFDQACLPNGFKFQDPSRMGVAVKSLLGHLRERQEQCGVRAFQFHHVLRNNTLEAAAYPASAQTVLDSEDPEDQVHSQALKPSQMKSEAKAITIQKKPIPMPPIGHNGSNAGPSTFVPDQHLHPIQPPVWNQIPDQHLHPIQPPVWNQMQGPNYWAPHFMSGPNPNSMPTYQQVPLMYDPQLMQQCGGQPGMPLPVVQPAGQLHQYSEQAVNVFHAPPSAVVPGMRFAAPLHPPNQLIDPHPMPSGDPPFALIYPQTPFDQRLIDHSVRTPTKKLPLKTPKKTPGKRKRKEPEDTPSQTPTRASNRTRTPRKLFEIDQ